MSVSFKGGIHIRMKRKTLSYESRPLTVCPELIFPLSQRRYGDYTPLVKPGDRVLAGQRIAVSDDKKAYIHSSVSGRVTDIKPHMDRSGSEIESVFIENDESYEAAAKQNVPENYDEAEPEELLSLLLASGIGELENGRVFADADDVRSRGIKSIIIDGTECEPNLSAAYRTIVENPKDIADGIHIALRIFGAKRALLTLRKNCPECIYAMKKAIRFDGVTDIITVHEKYPQSDERLLIKAAAGGTLAEGMKPEELGFVVLSVQTVYSISRIIKTGMPVTERIITVDGSAVGAPDNYRVPFGTPVSCLLKDAKAVDIDSHRIILGGPLSGTAFKSADIATVPSDSAVMMQDNIARSSRTEEPCIRCGRCVRACPSGLLPFKLEKAALKQRTDILRKNNIDKCIRCGACSYICPSCREIAGAIGKALDLINGKDESNV